MTGEVFDVAGNSASANVEIDLDQMAPLASSFVVDPATVPVAGTVLVTADAADATSGVVAAEAFVGDDPGDGAGVPLTVIAGDVVSGELTAPATPGIYPVGLRVQDAAGLWSTTLTASLTVEDEPDPSDLAVTVDPAEPASGWYTESPIVSATSSAPPIEVSIDGGPWETYTGPVTTTGDDSHTVAFRDSLGGAELVSFDVDGTAPTITASVDPVVGPEGWWTSTVTVTFTCDDATSGVATCPDPVVVDADGAGQVVTGEAIDVAGNTATTSVTIDLDTTAPTVSALTVDPATATAGSTVTVTADVADATSGIAAAEVFIGDDPGVGAGTPLTVIAGVASNDVMAPALAGDYTVGVRARDAAGWWSDTATTILTVTEPVGDLTVTVDPAEPASGWYTESPIVAATSSAPPIEVSIDGGPWETYTGPVTTTGDDSHTVAFRDSLGGAESVAFDVDGTAPTITASVDPVVGPEGWWTSTVTVTFTCDDATSGVATCPDPVVVDTDGADQVATGEAIDVAGNTATTSVTIDLDTTAPTVSALTVDPATATAGSTVTVTADVADTTSGIAAAEVFVGDDPGVGAGTPLTVIAGVASNDVMAPAASRRLHGRGAGTRRRRQLEHHHHDDTQRHRRRR